MLGTRVGGVATTAVKMSKNNTLFRTIMRNIPGESAAILIGVETNFCKRSVSKLRFVWPQVDTFDLSAVNSGRARTMAS